MCMGGCGGKSSAKKSSSAPKKSGGKSYAFKKQGTSASTSAFGKPKITFSGRR